MKKIFRVTPLFKRGQRDIASNYRPISVIPTLGKLFEWLIHTQTQKYLTDHNILNDNQAGFREGRSTGTCLVDFLHNIYAGVDQGRACGVLFLDLAKAFDSVCHEYLLVKLKCLGFKCGATPWSKSYLEGRSQVTSVGTSVSSVRTIDCGVPQGSIRGPLLLNCYVNDISDQLSFCKAFLYADDTVIVSTANTIAEDSACLNNDLLTLHRWFAANELCLNVDKTKCM